MIGFIGSFNLLSNRFQVIRNYCCSNVIAGFCVRQVVTWTDSRKTPKSVVVRRD